ncbi:hypothetical protein FRB96_006228 [Tulasnella sp. 330]|nr:hypothetical protein FRB96_006228 [Tulasnella sp. 330]KAG8875827.1 hypothetical protein FRB97_004682 [Tulasnella sp. 331]KAG8881267.1 hypothetical protein FRB98_004453 [Tulasnella sp. 332]
MSTESRAGAIIRQLDLKPLPKESGYLGLIGSSALTTPADDPPGGPPLAIQSQVYYMLTRDFPINYLHWLAPDDTHILVEGGPVDYFIFHPDGHVDKITLGRDYAAGQRPIAPVPGGCWKALRLHESVSFALMVNVLTPEFTADRVKIGAGAGWIQRYKGAASWATEENLRAFIGPNWTDN